MGSMSEEIRKKGMGFFRIVVIAILFLAIAVFFALTLYVRGINAPASDDPSLKTFTVSEGESSEDVSKRLKKEGLIKSSFLFDSYVWKNGYDDRIQIGSYDLPENLTIREVVSRLTRQNVRQERKITIIEGWAIQDIIKYFEKEGIANVSEFENQVTKRHMWWAEYDFIRAMPNNVDLEGYLFPDTYHIFDDATEEEITRKMLNNFSIKLTDELREEIRSQGKTMHEIITLASIIEKEVMHDEDKKIVAGIFYNRLDIGMGLQADSTVNYITGKGLTRSSIADTQIDNPYNTYRYRGLPPGPISNPGMSSILAAIYPTNTDYYYFLTTPEGDAIYSRTFEEHVNAKNKYL